LIIVDDCSKIENLNKLTDLSLNQNPLGTIPPFNNSKIRSLSLQDTSLRSAAFPASYNGSLLQRIVLSRNEIPSINEHDFAVLRYCKVARLTINSASVSKIDQNAFIPLIQLQELSLENNQLKSCEFLSTFRLLSSIKLDGNQFTSIPQELSAPKTIKSFSFKKNSISIIDESSPLHTWRTMNYTNIKIYLANNPFDCCQSLWFIQFLHTSPHFIGDASLLTCASPSSYAGKFLIKLNPDDMNCGGVKPNKSWWTTGRIIAVTVGGLVPVVALITVIIVFTRRKRSRSGYRVIDGTDDPSDPDDEVIDGTGDRSHSGDEVIDRIDNRPPPTAPFSPSNELLFPPYGEDNDDNFSSYSTAVTRQTTGSQAPTLSTAAGVSAIDENRS
jgi:hypothetical protein